MMLRHTLLLLALCSQTGCAALIDAAFRETQDHGRHASYPNKSFGGHYVDALLEDDDDDDCEYYCGHCHTTTVVVHHH